MEPPYCFPWMVLMVVLLAWLLLKYGLANPSAPDDCPCPSFIFKHVGSSKCCLHIGRSYRSERTPAPRNILAPIVQPNKSEPQ